MRDWRPIPNWPGLCQKMLEWEGGLYTISEEDLIELFGEDGHERIFEMTGECQNPRAQNRTQIAINQACEKLEQATHEDLREAKSVALFILFPSKAMPQTREMRHIQKAIGEHFGKSVTVKWGLGFHDEDSTEAWLAVKIY